MILKFLKFGLVGFVGLCIDFVLTYLFKEKFKVNKFLANTIGFSVAVANNYYLNRIWTFQDNDSQVIQQFMLFSVVSGLGLVLNIWILYILNEKFNFHFYGSKLVAIAVVFCWNFLINTFVTFNQST